MKDELKASLKRLGRLAQIKQTYVSVAEANVRNAEGEVRQLESAESKLTGNIQGKQAEIAYLRTATGHDVQSSEIYIQALELQRRLIRQSLEKANLNLEQRRQEWTEAMREQKIVEKVLEGRLHQWERQDDASGQKSQDEISIGRFVRTRREN